MSRIQEASIDRQERIMPIQLRAAGRTDVGRVRENNEDAFAIVRAGARRARTQSEEIFDVDRDAVLLAVSDGMGGHDAGELASATVIEALVRLVPAGVGGVNRLVDALEHAHAEVLAKAAVSGHTGMGATVVAALVTGTSLQLAWVGDSRAYRVRGAEVQLLSHDQNVAQMLVDDGSMDPEQLGTSPLKHILASAMGHGERPTIGTRVVDVVGGDKIVLCTDGLTNEVADSELAEIVGAHPSCAESCAALVANANRHGGRDNVTVIVAELLTGD